MASMEIRILSSFAIQAPESLICTLQLNTTCPPSSCLHAESLDGHAVNETGGVPPGNANGNHTWSIRRSAPKPELKLTPGKGIQDLTCSVEDLVDQVVKSNKVLRLFRSV